jgi:hypothetical protein
MLTTVFIKAALCWLILLFLAPSTVHGQGHFSKRDERRGYQVTTIYDRQTDSTRVTYTVSGASRPFGLKSRVWIDLAFVYPGRRLTSFPEAVTVTLVSFTPSRGGWAFARPHTLRIACADGEKVRVLPMRYERLPVHLFDPGRREALSFRLSVPDLLRLEGEELLDLKAGQATIRFREKRMAMLSDLIAQLTPKQ